MKNIVRWFLICVLSLTAGLGIGWWISGNAIAAIIQNTGTLQKDANNQAMQVAPGFSLIDGTAASATISNLALTSNVVTITTGTHGYVVGQQVTIALLTGPTLFADCNGTFIIASVPGATSFTYAFTHANISTGAATGTTTAYMASPMPTNTTRIPLVFPAKAIHLVVTPLTANATLEKTSGGATNGTITLFYGAANHISGVEGDTVYINRPNTTVLEFQFDTAR